jgi:AcrR family transcriptional regulator
MSKEIERKILDAATEVVSREKISGTRMHMIAKEANMSPANLHYHFSSKADIMRALLDDIKEKFSAERKEHIDIENQTVVENIRGFFEQKKNDIFNNRKLEFIQFDYWVQGTVNEEIRAKFQNSFENWRESIKEVLDKGGFKNSDDPEYMNMLPFILVSLMLGASLQYLMDEEKFNLDEYFNIVEKILFGTV